MSDIKGKKLKINKIKINLKSKLKMSELKSSVNNMLNLYTASTKACIAL